MPFSRIKENFIIVFFSAISTIAVLSISFRSILWNLNSTLLDGSGDGFKNCYTFSYQYQFGNGIYFHGLLYPYGDLANFADAQILIVWILQLLRFTGIDLQNYLLLIINVLPVISFGIAVFVFTKIFRHYKIPLYMSIVFAIVGISLSPQVFRMQGHFALSYSFVIPLFWLGIIELQKSQSLKVLISIFIGVILFGFIHPYYPVILCFFVLAYFVAKVFIDCKPNLYLALLGLIPLVSFWLIMNGLDPTIDRPANPYGMNVYKTEFSDVFPFYGAFHQLFGETLNLRNSFHEGYCYPGFLILIVPLFIIVRLLIKHIFHHQWDNGISIPRELKLYFFSSLVVLSFAMGLQLFFGQTILDLVKPVQQFRTLGRFSWIFYYISFTYLAVFIYQRIIQSQKRPIKITCIFIVFIVWSYEIKEYHKAFGKNLHEYSSDNLLRTNTQIFDMLGDKSLSPARFQAVLTLPASTEGAEKITMPQDWWLSQYGFPFSYQSGLPLTSCVLSRTPLSKVLKILQMSSSVYAQKEVLDDLVSDKPFLMIIPDQHKTNFNDLISKSKYINHDSHMWMYELPVDFLVKIERIDSSIYSDALVLDTLPEDSLFILSSGSLVYFNDFKLEDTRSGLLSKGAIFVKDKSKLILKASLDIDSTKMIELSLWYEIIKDKSSVPSFEFRAIDQSGAVLQQQGFRDWDFNRVEVYKNWIQLKNQIELSPLTKKIELEAFGKYLFVDKILLKSKDLNIILNLNETDQVLYNHYISNISKD